MIKNYSSSELDKWNEDELKLKIIKRLRTDFWITSEIKGFFLVDNTHVRIDLLLKAKKHLITNQGFTKEWFGIEIKGVTNTDAARKGKDLAWQAITYRMSKFGRAKRRPAFVLTYPPIQHFFDDLDEKSNLTGSSDAFQLVTFLERANVGSLSFLDKNIWRISFGTQNYCTKDNPINSKINFGTKKNIGNCNRRIPNSNQYSQ